MRSKLKNITRKKIEKEGWQGFELIILSLTASAGNYFFQLMLGRLLSVSEYGQYNAVNSFISNMLNIFTPLTIIVCRITAEKRNLKVNYYRYKQILNVILASMGIILAISVMIYPHLKGKYCSETIGGWLIVVSTIFASAIYSLMLALLQGCKLFRQYGWIGLILIIFKIVLSYYAIKYCMGVVGCVLAMLISNVVLAFYSYFILKKYNREYHYVSNEGYEKRFEWRELLDTYGNTFVVGMVYSLYINGGEILLFNYVFSEKTIGLYSAAIALGKISFYVVSIVCVIIFPNIAGSANDKDKLKKMIVRGVFVSGFISVSYALVYGIMGDFIIDILYGRNYSGGSYMIGYVDGFVVMISIMSIFHNVLIGINKLREYMWILLIVIIFTVCGVLTVGHFVTDALLIVTLSVGVIIMGQIVLIRKYLKDEERIYK